jgi:hypothetical protein
MAEDENQDMPEPSAVSTEPETPARTSGWIPNSVKSILKVVGFGGRSQVESPSKPSTSPTKVQRDNSSANTRNSKSQVRKSDTQRITQSGPRFGFLHGSKAQAPPALGSAGVSLGTSQALRSFPSSTKSAMVGKRLELAEMKSKSQSARPARTNARREAEPASPSPAPRFATRKRKAAGRTFGFDDDDLIDSDDEREAQQEAGGPAGKKARFEDSTEKHSFYSSLPIPGQPGYRSSTQLPPPDTSGWIPEAIRTSTALVPHDPVPEAPLGKTIRDLITTTDTAIDDSISINEDTRGRTFGLIDSDDESESDLSSSDVEDWEGRKFSQWTEATALAYKNAPLPPDHKPIAEDVLHDVMHKVLVDKITPFLKNYSIQEAYPELAALHITPDDFLIIDRPDGGVERVSHATYWSTMTKPMGTEHMTAKELVVWKAERAHVSHRKYRYVIRKWRDDDSHQKIEEVNKNRKVLNQKRKRLSEVDQEVSEREEELEHRKRRLEELEKSLEERSKALEEKQKLIEGKSASGQSSSPSKRPNVAAFGSSSTYADDDAGASIQAAREAAARVKLPSSPLAMGNSTTTASASNSPAWTTPPPPAPSPAHAQLPQTKPGAGAPAFIPTSSTATQSSTQASLVEALEREKMKANRHAPKKSSNLREMSRFSTPTSTPDLSKDSDDMAVFEDTPTTVWNHRLPTPPPFNVEVPMKQCPVSTDRVEAAIEIALNSLEPQWKNGIGTVLMPEISEIHQFL